MALPSKYKFTVQDLQFKKFEDQKTPTMNCNFCSKSAPAYGWHVAEVEISEDSQVMFVVCGDDCLAKFKNNPMVNWYINDVIREAKQIEALK
jgi:hypothetical protein